MPAASSLLRQIVDLHRRQLLGVVEIRGVGRMRKLYGEARRDLEDRLASMVSAGRGATFGAQHLRQVLVQVADVAGGFQKGLRDHLRDTGRMAAILAPRHATDTVARMEAHFGRMTPVVQAEQAALVAGVHDGVASTLLSKYDASVKTYGAQTISAIQQHLAGSILRQESLDDAVDRVAGARGLFERQRWRAERIVRTEMSYSYGLSKQRGMEALHVAVPRLMKRLVATHDARTGEDSEDLDGQTVEVHQPFVWHVKNSRGAPTGKVVHYMQPPNRPNDREVVVEWMPEWGAAASSAIEGMGDVRAIAPRGP